jgi:hypothetical protein
MASFLEALLGGGAARRPANPTIPMQGAPMPVATSTPPAALTAQASGGGMGNLWPIVQALGIGISRNDLGAGAAIMPQLMANAREDQQTRQQTANQTAYTTQFLEQNGDTDLAGAVKSGVMSPADAFSQSLKRKEEKEKTRVAGAKREIEKDPNGVPRYLDTGEPVFPGVSTQTDLSKRPRAKDPAGIERWLDTGEPVFPGVEVPEDKQLAEKKAARSEAATNQAMLVKTAIDRAKTTLGVNLQTGEEDTTPHDTMLPNFIEGDRVTGLAGKSLSMIPGTKAYDLSEQLNTIKANLGFDKLQQMRDNSPTGGALGPVSDFENKLLQSTIASLEQGQSREEFKKSLDIVERVYNKIVNEGIKEGDPIVDEVANAGPKATDPKARLKSKYGLE